MVFGVDPFTIVRITDPAEFDLIKAGIEHAEQEAENHRRELAGFIAKALGGK